MQSYRLFNEKNERITYIITNHWLQTEKRNGLNSIQIHLNIHNYLNYVSSILIESQSGLISLFTIHGETVYIQHTSYITSCY